jgi:ATP-binding cassette subfamily C (CFTR/MRP) protein 1
LDIPRARTVWAIDGLHTVAIVFIVSMLIKAVICGLEVLEKQNLIIDHYKDGSPETWAGVFNRSLFGWLNPLLLSGNKTVFSLNDLYSMEKAMVPDPDIKHKLAVLWEECK